MYTVLSRKQADLTASDTSRVNKELNEYCGLSTDEKPNGLIVTGSTFLEIDTGDLYIYNEEAAEWVQFINIKDAAGGGGDTPTSYEVTSVQTTFTAEGEQPAAYIPGPGIRICNTESGAFGPTIKVVLDGITYDNLEYHELIPDAVSGWGHIPFDEIPFAMIADGSDSLVIMVDDTNEHTLEVILKCEIGSVELTNASDSSSADARHTLDGNRYLINQGETVTLPLLLEGGIGTFYLIGEGLSSIEVSDESNVTFYQSGDDGSLVVYNQPASMVFGVGSK